MSGGTLAADDPQGQGSPVTLSADHRKELAEASAISNEMIAERGYRTFERHDREELAGFGIHIYGYDVFPGLLLPMFRATGELISAQFKPARPITIQGRSVKYLSPRGQGNRLDVHPRNRCAIADPTVPLWITEGIKKSDSLTSRGCCVVTLTGVFNWRNRFGTLGDWEDVRLKGRDVVLCFDADARTNMNVARAMLRLGRWCKSKGVKGLRYLIVPSEYNGRTTKGADDYFAAGGSLEELQAHGDANEPDTGTLSDTFTDSRLAETIADEVFAERFAWCKALGWLQWTGRRWVEVTEEAVLEAARRFALAQFGKAHEDRKCGAIEGWHSTLKANRLRGVVILAKGIVEREATAFDADPDVLNTPGGVVNLRTGELFPHDPELLLTKITRGCYRPGYVHPDWEQALTGIPEDSRAWFQVRVGQAITGHPTPDGLIPVLQGGGENGKSAFTTDGIVPALGDYAAPVSAKLITSSKDEHSTERADLRGQRFLIAEELTEDRALNVTAIKQITDVGSIKARYVYRDNFTFEASHSLFVTTNYIPVVNETDHGTWRRLALLEFPYMFRKPNEPLTTPTERLGDPGLKRRIRDGAGGQHDAVLTWAVEGARRSYEGMLPLPPRVKADTHSWRKHADRILGFWDECLAPDENSLVLTTEVFQTFNAWLRTNGHREWSKELFHPRFKQHDETKRHRVAERRTMKLHGLSRHPSVVDLPRPRQALVYAGVRFRNSDEVNEDVAEDSVADVADSSRNLPESILPGRVPKRCATAATEHVALCCQSGPLAPSCSLCRNSPTYWRREQPGDRSAFLK
jgi:putative DNA primase/helicase